jgi:hypothetical protein
VPGAEAVKKLDEASNQKFYRVAHNPIIDASGYVAGIFAVRVDNSEHKRMLEEPGNLSG